MGDLLVTGNNRKLLQPFVTETCLGRSSLKNGNISGDISSITDRKVSEEIPFTMAKIPAVSFSS